ncbi:MAG: cyclase family protein [Candidatus Thermoplasmatota archaeon]|jgi:kynurenine formamidase|nr:cyclase family protein [Candidatus Thermoplasmatota archaeon]MCL5790008.1 cyclase family protein [Candidatus Thermoplasmatota archaeon]
MEIRGIYDLSVTLKTYMPIWPTSPLLNIAPIGIASRDGYSIESFSSATHTGTHVDAPYHFIDTKATVDELPLNQLVGEGYVIRPELEGTEITLKQLKAKWKNEFDGKIVLINTGWDKKRGFTREFQYEFPGLSLDTVDFLVEHRPKVIGIDTLGIEPYSHSDFKVHKALLSKGFAFIEDLAGLDQLAEGKKYLIAALPLKIFRGSGAMARVIAMDVY